MDRSQQRQRGIATDIDLSAQDFADGSVIRKVCEVAPLSPEQQREQLLVIRRSTLIVRAEVARFPGVLELLGQKDFSAGEFSEREKIAQALQETRALWLRRDEPAWRETYEQLLSRNAGLAMRAFDQLFDLSDRPYADIMAIEGQVRQLCRGALVAGRFDTEHEAVEARSRYEELALRPFDDITAAAERIRQADEGAQPSRKVMVESNLRLVARAVSNFKSNVGRSGIDAPGALDLFQEGVFGLMAAMDRFRPELGNRFSTYALHWIQQAIGKCHAGDEMIAVPHHVKALVARERRIRDELIRETGDIPGDEEIQGRMGLSAREYRLVRQAKKAMVESGTRELDGEEVEALDLVAADLSGERRAREVSEAESRIARALLRLFEGKALVVMARRFTSAYRGNPVKDGLTFMEIGEELGLTRQRISQLEQLGIATLADFFIVESSRPATRAQIFRRVCTLEELAVIDSLFAERYESKASKVTQVGILRRCATALIVAQVGPEEWQSFSEAAELSPLRAFLVHDRIIRGNTDFYLAAKRAIAAGVATTSFHTGEAERVFAATMNALAPFARSEFKRRNEVD